jgi:hypothetical protein
VKTTASTSATASARVRSGQLTHNSLGAGVESACAGCVADEGPCFVALADGFLDDVTSDAPRRADDKDSVRSVVHEASIASVRCAGCFHASSLTLSVPARESPSIRVLVVPPRWSARRVGFFDERLLLSNRKGFSGFGCGPAREEVECLSRLRSWLRAVDEKCEAFVGGELHGFVGELEVADDGMVEPFVPGAMLVHIMSSPADAELLASGGEFADQVGETFVVGVPSSFRAEGGDGVGGDEIPVGPEVDRSGSRNANRAVLGGVKGLSKTCA